MHLRGGASSRRFVLNTNVRCGPEAEVRPTKIVLTCATGEGRIEGLQWSHWGSQTAKATGIFNVQGCEPSCAGDNRTYSYPVAVEAHQPTDCRGGRRQYTFISYTITGDVFDANRPGDGTMGFDCPK